MNKDLRETLEGFESSDRSPAGVPVNLWERCIYDTRIYRGGTDTEIREAFFYEIRDRDLV